MSRFLVTGATGFVGKHLCQDLIEKGHKVTATIRKAQEIKGCETVLINDITAQTDWAKALEGIDYVIHLAARVHVMNETAQDPLQEFLAVNRDGTQKLAQDCAQAGVKRLVFLSSIKVNGEETQPDHPYTPDQAAHPQDPYGISKWQAEQALTEIANTSNLEYTIVRPPLVYGAGVKANFAAFIKLANKGWPVPFGCLDNKRSLVYVKNLTDALITCALHEKAKNQTYLVSDGEDLSLKETFSLLSQSLGKKSCHLPIPKWSLKLAGQLTGRSAQIHRLTSSLQVDSSKLQSDLSWQAPYDLKSAFQQTCDWFKS